MLTRTCVAAVCVLGWTVVAGGAEPFRYPEAKMEGAELRYVGDVPVLSVSGSPEEIGKQIGTLAAAAAPKLMDYPRACLREVNLEFTAPTILEIGEKMVANFPDDHRRELDAIIAASGVKRSELVLGNTLYDIKKVFGCSALTVEANRSATGGVLFGRNLDFPTLGVLQDYTVITVYKPTGKRAWASIGFPGMVGCLSGMNDAGLAVAVLEVRETADGATRLNTKGMTYGCCHRRIMEECSTIDEAYKLYSSLPRTTLINLAVADTKTGVVFEITPKQIVQRPASAGLCAATNHFRTEELAVDTRCYRYDRLIKTKNYATVDADLVWAMLDHVNQGHGTLQTMIFEPAELRVRLSIGPTPTSKRPGTLVDLKPFLQADSALTETPVVRRVKQAAE